MHPIHIIQLILLTVVIAIVVMRAVYEARKNRCKKCGSFNNWPFTEVSDCEELTDCEEVVHGMKCKKCNHFEKESSTGYRSKKTGKDAGFTHHH